MEEIKKDTYKFVFDGVFKKRALFPFELFRLASIDDKEELEQIDFFDKKREIDLYLQNASIFMLHLNGEYVGLGILMYPYWRKDIAVKNVRNIGIHVAEKYRGRGFGRSIAQHMIAICLDQENIPVAECLMDNPISKATLESAGFVLMH